MGVRVRAKADCVGVLVPVNDEELAQFDLRELGYDRLPIDPKDVRLADGGGGDDDEKGLPLYPQSTIWVYVQQSPEPVSQESPIAQTYLDVILRGCLSISEQFARDFLQTTRGWHLKDFEHTDEAQRVKQDVEGGDDSILEHHVHWVNDRKNPLYVRADVEYSKTHAHVLDRILQEHRPEWVHRRTM